MKNYLKIPILLTVIAFSACRSHKAIEVSDYSANDSCVAQTDLRVHSFTNIAKNETISSHLAQDHMEFSDGAGEIRIYSNGQVSIKGLKSANLMRQNTKKHSAMTVAITDSVTATSHEKSAKITTSATKAEATIPVSSSIWIKILFVIIIIILIIRFIRPR